MANENILSNRGRLMIILRYMNHCRKEDEAHSTLRMMSTTGRKRGEIFLANLCLKKAVALREKAEKEVRNWENRLCLEAEYNEKMERFHEVVKKSSVAVLRPLRTTRDC